MPGMSAHHGNASQEFGAELIGTFALVFTGCGALIVQAQTSALDQLGVALVFGAAVAAMIYALGPVSGGHFNPAITLAFWSSGSMPGRKVPYYVAAQLLGASAAAFLLFAAFGNVANLGATLPRNNAWQQALVLEAVQSFLLMLVVLGSGLDRRLAGSFAGLAIGLIIAVNTVSMGPMTGASMNPARSFGPAVVSASWGFHWVYWVAPIVGAQLAVLAHRLLWPWREP
jgi:aquaporin Z